MKQAEIFESGAVRVHKKVIAEIVESVIAEIEEVHLPPKGLFFYLGKIFNINHIPGIQITFDENQDIVLDVKITIKYGLNIPDMAKHIQQAIASAVEKTVDINLKDIKVNIQGIERRAQ